MRSSLSLVLQSGRSGLDTVALAAEVIAADARFNLWVAHTGKQQLNEDEMIELIEFYDGLVEQCRSAVAAFFANGNAANLNEFLATALAKLRETV
jgi:hypothetical protein